MTTLYHQDLRSALKEAYDKAPCGIAWTQSVAASSGNSGWFTYDLSKGAPPGVIPEYLIQNSNSMPIAMTESAIQALVSLFKSLLMNKRIRNVGEKK